MKYIEARNMLFYLTKEEKSLLDVRAMKKMHLNIIGNKSNYIKNDIVKLTYRGKHNLRALLLYLLKVLLPLIKYVRNLKVKMTNWDLINELSLELQVTKKLFGKTWIVLSLGSEE